MTSYLAGDILTADALNLRPFFHGYQVQGATQTLSALGFYPLTFTGEVSDTIGGHNTALNTSRYTPSLPGLYRVTASVSFINTAVGKFSLTLRKNGSTDNGARVSAHMADNSPTFYNTGDVSGTIRCNGGTDYIEVHVYHAFAGATATVAGPDYGSYMICEWVAP